MKQAWEQLKRADQQAVTKPKATHTTTWEDDGMAAYICSRDAKASYGSETSTLSTEDDCGNGQCPVCGQRLRLVWDVRIEEVES
jgi:C4-type Zn-finger protein